MKQQAIDILKAMKRKAEIKRWTWCGYMIETLDEAIHKIEALWDGWIPVTERLPDEEWLYLAITVKWRDVVVASLWAVNQKSYDTTSMISYYTYTHWKPIWDLPLPPNK